MSAHIDDMQKNLKLVNQVISSGFWSVECDQNGKPEEVFFSHDRPWNGHCQEFCTDDEGDIKVESEPGKGSKFTVTIFLKLQNKKLDAIDELIDLPVLVVDDDQDCCENTVVLLEEIGIDGEWVTSGEEAVVRTVERYERNDNYFAIILDWKMPGMDGIETTRQIRKKVENDVTIIILSAYDYAEIEKEAREAGVDEFIAKPLDMTRLRDVLRKWL